MRNTLLGFISLTLSASSVSAADTWYEKLSLDEALKISEETSIEVLAQLPKEKIPCFTLATDALKLAIEEYRCKSAEAPEKGRFNVMEIERKEESGSSND